MARQVLWGLLPEHFQRIYHKAREHLVSLSRYIRRLVITGFDLPEVLQQFFGQCWRTGIDPIRKLERRNYLFAAKSETWLRVKETYDMSIEESVPLLGPLQAVTEEEIRAAEQCWSDWLLMQDWMIGPRALAIGLE